MKSIKQLLREPMKTLFGVILVAIAVAALCVCLGQSFAAAETEKRLNETYMTAAFAEADTNSLQSTWLSTYAAEHPEVVKTVSYAGLASAYIPGLTLDNWTQHWHVPLASSTTMCAPYDTAILEITLTEIGESMGFQTYAKDWAGNYITDENGELMPLEYPGENVIVSLTGIVERAVALEEGYPDPTGFTARLTLRMPSQAALDALNLTVGERYLVYGTNYSDLDWELRHSVAGIMTWNKDMELPEWDLDTFRWMNGYEEYNWPEELEAVLDYGQLDEGWINVTDPSVFAELLAKYPNFNWEQMLEAGGYPAPGSEDVFAWEYPNPDSGDAPAFAMSYYVSGFKCKIGDLYHLMGLGEYHSFRSVSMSLSDDGVGLKSEILQNEDGTWVCNLIEERSYIDENGQEVFISQEEYAQRYREPTIVHLTGTAEEFLESQEGELWREALDNVEVNNHAFAVVGVDALRCIENFNSGTARIIQGRDFLVEELETGAKVCIISKQLAEANGLSVGDTIDPEFYDPDLSLEYQVEMEDNSFAHKPFYYFSNTTQLRSHQSYTIVGIYEQNDPTPSMVTTDGQPDNPYGFTSNTIFAPKASIDAAMQYGEEWFFKTVVLHNGALEEFQLAAIEANLGEAFRYTDNGYSNLEESLLSYQAGANRAMVIGVAVYGIVLLLYLVLYPARQGAALATMESLGAPRPRRIRYILGSSLGILIPSTILGAGAAMLLWQGVVDMIAADGAAALEIRMNISTMVSIAAVQLALAAVLVFLLSLPMTGSKSLMTRK